MSLAIQHLFRFGQFTLDAGQRVLLREGKPVPMTPKVFDLLLLLVENNGRIVEKEEMMKRLWPETFVEEANLTSNIQQLRKSLGDNARKPIYIETVARRGYRFIAPVGIDSEDADTFKDIVSAQVKESSLAQVKESSLLQGQARPPLRRWLIPGAIAAVTIAALFYWILWFRSPALPQPLSGRLTLAVLPLKNLTGDDSQEYFSDGLTEEMITHLGNLDPAHLGVIARTSVMHYKNSQASLEQIGRELGVQYVLEGSVRRESDRVRITAQLIQVKDQTHLWAREYDRELSHLLSLQGEIAREVANEINLTIGRRRTEPAHPSLSDPSSYEAYDLYLKGQFFWNKRRGDSLGQAADYFQRATRRDPSYARAYAGLADSYALISGYAGFPQIEFMPKARDAALRALEIDDSLPEAHTALGLIVQNYDWDWPAAEKEFRRAIELNPNYATAHQWYAEHLMWLGRFDEALRESERARELDPLSLIIASDHGAILYFSRQYDQAIKQLRAVLEMEPMFVRAHLVRSAYIEKGSFTDALADLKSTHADGTEPWYLSGLADIYGRLGQRAKARSALEKLLQINQRNQIDAGLIISAYLGLGDKQQVLAWLEKAYAQHDNIITTLKVEPAFDSLRGDLRFQDLLHRVRLDQ